MNTAALLAERPVTALRGVGPALAELLAKLGLHTVQDVLFHLPLRYEDRTRVVPIGTLRNGALSDRRFWAILATAGQYTEYVPILIFAAKEEDSNGFAARVAQRRTIAEISPLASFSVDLNIRCSRKWAMPDTPGGSSALPTR